MTTERLHKYPRTHHLEGSRLQPGDEDLSALPLTELAGRYVVIEEKVDGANAAISFAPSSGDDPPTLQLQSRGHFLAGGAREKHFALFKDWASCHTARLQELLGTRYVLYGEWLYAKHTIFYDALPHYFLEFDLFDTEDGSFASTALRDCLLDRAIVSAVPVLYRGKAPRKRAELEALIQRSLYKSPRWQERLREAAAARDLDVERIVRETDPSELAEGLYVKVEEDDKVVERYKFVRASFLTAVVDSGSHWLSRPIVPNQLAPGVDIYVEDSRRGPPRSSPTTLPLAPLALALRARDSRYPLRGGEFAVLADGFAAASGPRFAGVPLRAAPAATVSNFTGRRAPPRPSVEGEFDALRAVLPPQAPPSLDALLPHLPALRELQGCPQDPIFHAEGDVWIHTQRVLEALIALPGWQALPEDRRLALALAALLHDIAKPSTTVEVDGRLRSPGHARRGAQDARILLYQLGAPFALRERVVGLIRHHAMPLFALEDDDIARRLHAVSQRLPCTELALLAEADVRGRDCGDQQDLLERIALFVELCRDEACLDGPRAFASDHSRIFYFEKDGRAADHVAHDDTQGEVVLLSGLPGAGKDTLARQHYGELPQISLDALRQELGAPATGKQGPVIDLARQRSREYLRRGESFVWNATSLSHSLRERVIALCRDYRMRVRIAYVEVAWPRLVAQNAARDDAVPQRALEQLLLRWDLPTPLEAHAVEYHVDGSLQALLGEDVLGKR